MTERLDWNRHHKNRVMFTREWQDDAWRLLRWHYWIRQKLTIELAMMAMLVLVSFRIS